MKPSRGTEIAAVILKVLNQKGNLNMPQPTLTFPALKNCRLEKKSMNIIVSMYTEACFCQP